MQLLASIMHFKVAKWLENNHLIEYAPDMALGPPQSYLFVQDFLILSCAVIYCFCYLFYTIRTKRDRYLAGPIDALYAASFTFFLYLWLLLTLNNCRFGNIAYELYFPFTVASSWLQRAGCLAWLLLDVRFTYTAIKYACAPEKRAATVTRTICSVVVTIMLFRILGQYFPDDGEQLTPYWIGWLLEMPVGWISVWLLYNHEHTRGQSLEIW